MSQPDGLKPRQLFTAIQATIVALVQSVFENWAHRILAGVSAWLALEWLTTAEGRSWARKHGVPLAFLGMHYLRYPARVALFVAQCVFWVLFVSLLGIGMVCTLVYALVREVIYPGVVLASFALGIHFSLSIVHVLPPSASNGWAFLATLSLFLVFPIATTGAAAMAAEWVLKRVWPSAIPA